MKLQNAKEAREYAYSNKTAEIHNTLDKIKEEASKGHVSCLLNISEATMSYLRNNGFMVIKVTWVGECLIDWS